MSAQGSGRRARKRAAIAAEQCPRPAGSHQPGLINGERPPCVRGSHPRASCARTPGCRAAQVHAGAQRRGGLVGGAQVVVRDARRQVMDVVVADVAGDPAQHRRQVVERAAVDRGGVRIPVGACVPSSSLRSSAARRTARLRTRRRSPPPAGAPAAACASRAAGTSAPPTAQQREIVERHAAPFLLPAPRHAERQSVLGDELVDRPDAEHARACCGRSGSRNASSASAARYSVTVSVRMSPSSRWSRLPDVA